MNQVMTQVMIQERATWLTMNDGIRLDATVCTPEGAAPRDGWPAVLLIHGHGDTACKLSCLPRARRLAQRGYLTVAYSVRGQGASEGLCFHMGPRELFDLQDVIDWVLQELPVHPDRLGVAGSSQGGWHSYMAAAHHPRVATVVPENIFTDYAEFGVMDGCLNRWFFARTMQRRIMTAGFQDLARQWALSGDWDLLQAWLRDRSPLVFADRIRCPVFILHGWHDVGMPPNQALAMFERLQGPKKLYLGGGGHDGQDDPQALALRDELIDRWFDHWLKGEANGIMQEPPVTCTLRPGWEHIALDSADKMVRADRLQTLYLQPGTLQAPAPEADTIPSNVANIPIDGSYDLRAALHDDMAGVATALPREECIFDADPCDEDLALVGTPRIQLHLLPNHPAFQVHAELYDVGTPGDSPHGRLISRGHMGTRSAQPGLHLSWTIEARTIAYRLALGHRLRLVVTNCNTTFAYPFFHSSCTRLYHDPERPSCVELPVHDIRQ